MKLNKIGLLLVCLGLSLASCKKDDTPNVTIELRDRTEQQEADNDSIIKYLSSHYYNAAEIEAAKPNAGINDIVINELTGSASVPDGHELLMSKVVKYTVDYENTTYDYYVLNLNQGGGEDKPTIGDKIQVLYEGFSLENYIFDFKYYPDKNTLDLAGVIPGWRRVIPKFNISEGFVVNGDGTTDYINSGLGVMFIPSGLAYFSSAPTGVSSYSPLAFKFELLQTSVFDHDGDGIPSYYEDLNDDGEFNVNYSDLKDETDDDTDGNGFADYVDSDDDGDNILTINELKPTTYTVNSNLTEQEPVLAEGEFEISRTESAGIITIKTVTIIDSNNDGIPDYRDKNIKINYNK